MPGQDDDRVEKRVPPRQDKYTHDNPYANGPRVRLGQSSAERTSLDEEVGSAKRGAFSSILGHDPATRKLMGFAIIIVVVLLLITGVWLLLGGRHQGIPIIGPPDFVVKDKPADPGGMQVMSDDNSHSDVTGKGAVHLAPPPEQPDARVLARRAETETVGHTSVQDNAPTRGTSQSASSSMSGQTTSKNALSSQQTAAPSAPATVPSPQPAAPPSTTAQTSSPAPFSKQGEGRYQVQLGALDSQARAERAWLEFRAKASNIIGSHTPRYQQITHNGKIFVRLRIGGFSDVTSARLFCARLHAQSLACAPVAF